MILFSPRARYGPMRAADEGIINSVFVYDEYRINELATLLSSTSVSVIVDVGAHIGAFTLKLGYRWGTATKICIEPNLLNLEQLQNNIHDSKLPNTKIIQAAISYNPLKKFLLYSANNPAVSLLVTETELHKFKTFGVVDHYIYHRFNNEFGEFKVQTEPIEVITLEELMDRERLSHIDLLKLDCEGYEIDAIERMEQSTADKIKAVVGEYHIAGGSSEFSKLFKSKFPNHSLELYTPNESLGLFRGFKYEDVHC